MKIQCDVCERAEAAVLCCADEAALCWGCDEKVHAANKLAGKHQRVPLLPRAGSASSPLPTCDICQSKHSSYWHEMLVINIKYAAIGGGSRGFDGWFCKALMDQEKAGYFFCLEDRALLCRQCDVAIHTVSPYVSSHQRFLITGVRVALQHHLTNSSDSSSSSNSNGNSTSSNTNSNNPTLSSLASNTSLSSKKLQMAPTGLAMEEVEDLRPPWSWNEILDGVELDQYYGFSEPCGESLHPIFLHTGTKK